MPLASRTSSHMVAPPKPQQGMAATLFSSPPALEQHSPRVQGDGSCLFWSLSLPQSRSLVQGYCCEVVWQRLLLLLQSPESLWCWLGSVKTHGNGTPSAWAAHVVWRTRRKEMSWFFSQLPKRAGKIPDKTAACLGAYSEQLSQLVCKPYENNIRPATPASQGNIQPRKSIPTDLEIIAAKLSVKEQQQKIQNLSAENFKKPM